MSSVYDILDAIESPQTEYAERMYHTVPKATVVKREEYILDHCTGKTVLDVGCAGTDGQARLFHKIRGVAKSAYGIDSQECDAPNTLQCHGETPFVDSVSWSDVSFDLVVLGEVLEHIENPGSMLRAIQHTWPGATVLITVPNAFSHAGFKHAAKGIEHVNIDHVSWYSWRTLKTLVERCGYRVVDFKWYNGIPMFAEGLIFLCERNDDGNERPDTESPDSEA